MKLDELETKDLKDSTTLIDDPCARAGAACGRIDRPIILVDDRGRAQYHFPRGNPDRYLGAVRDDC